MSTAKFYSDAFKLENQQAHQTHKQYGSVSGYVFYFGGENLPLMGTSVLTLIRELEPGTVLDYGCGKGLGADNLVYNYPDLHVTKYDPFVDQFAQQPQAQYDMVICYNVLQIVEQEYLDAVIQHCVELTKKNLFLNILYNKKSPRDLAWWSTALSEYPVVAKGTSIPKPSHDRHGETFDSSNVSFWIQK